jgi:hypothetical protein
MRNNRTAKQIPFKPLNKIKYSDNPNKVIQNRFTENEIMKICVGGGNIKKYSDIWTALGQKLYE